MAVKVRRERPDQRRHHRLTAPLFVETGGFRMRAADWSLGGLRVEHFPGPVPSVGTELALNLTLPFQGFDVTFTVRAEIVRIDPSISMFAVEFIELGERERELMQHFIEELVRGAMGEVEDTIQRIDVPVTPASLQPDQKPAGASVAPAPLPVRRWPVKTVLMAAFYIVAGLIIFGYAGILAYTNVFRMEVQTAVISAPVETVESPADGRITWQGVQPGDAIRAGEVILEVIDSELEREIELADIAVKEKKARLAFLKRRHADELDRLQGFATIEMKNVEQSKLDLEATAAELEAARQQHQRLKMLHQKGFTTDARLEEAESRMVTLEKQLERRRVELTARIELAEANLGKRLYTGDDLIGRSGELDAEVSLARREVELAQQRHIANLNKRQRQAVRAPFDGTILKLPRVDQGSVRRGDVIAIVEQRRDREVTAFLTQDEISKVGLGDEALLYLPALGETLKGRVTSIDRTSGFIREQELRANPGYAWRGPTDRSARVTIAFDDPQAVADFERYRSGLPVVVVFEQRTRNSIVSQLAQKLSMALEL